MEPQRTRVLSGIRTFALRVGCAFVAGHASTTEATSHDTRLAKPNHAPKNIDLDVFYSLFLEIVNSPGFMVGGCTHI